MTATQKNVVQYQRMRPQREELLRLKALLTYHGGFTATFSKRDFQNAVRMAPYIGAAITATRMR